MAHTPKSANLLAHDVELVRQKISRAGSALHEARSAAGELLRRKAEIGADADAVLIPGPTGITAAYDAVKAAEEAVL